MKSNKTNEEIVFEETLYQILKRLEWNCIQFFYEFAKAIKIPEICRLLNNVLEKINRK